jgi:hypothetical protein
MTAYLGAADAITEAFDCVVIITAAWTGATLRCYG